ncbi:hypothetical protein BY996DRAFT_6464235 [Phakopsora pachyrhizi]|nr:hypothetical protein BY996DRAFT_6464235 [Phakopsora pachyrhizi]
MPVLGQLLARRQSSPDLDLEVGMLERLLVPVKKGYWVTFGEEKKGNNITIPIAPHLNVGARAIGAHEDDHGHSGSAKIPTLDHQQQFGSSSKIEGLAPTSGPGQVYKDTQEVTEDFGQAFSYLVVGGMGVVTAAGDKSLVSNFLTNLSAPADVLALAKVEIKGKLVFIHHWTQAKIQEANTVEISALQDPQTDSDCAKRPEWLGLRQGLQGGEFKNGGEEDENGPLELTLRLRVVATLNQGYQPRSPLQLTKMMKHLQEEAQALVVEKTELAEGKIEELAKLKVVAVEESQALECGWCHLKLLTEQVKFLGLPIEVWVWLTVDKITEEQRIEDREDIGLQEKEAEKIVDLKINNNKSNKKKKRSNKK